VPLLLSVFFLRSIANYAIRLPGDCAYRHYSILAATCKLFISVVHNYWYFVDKASVKQAGGDISVGQFY